MNKKVSDLGEFGLIESLKPFCGKCSSLIKGIGDDTAVLKYNKTHYQLMTTDLLIEDRHFSKKEKPELIGQKAMNCSISDIAAMGGAPTFAVVSLGVLSDMAIEDVKKIYEGMRKAARRFDCVIVGGDTVASDKLIINVALLGEVQKKHLVLRDGAKVGDMICVTGPLGNTLNSKKHLSFTPRVQEARILVEKYKPSAMIDISDGLVGDLQHILRASKVGAVLDEKSIPLNKGASLVSALSGGEDFELLFTLSAVKAKALEKDKRLCCFVIGRIVSKRQDQLKKMKVKGFAHF